LYEKGGWWVDMDVTCLQPFDIHRPYFFRSHHDLTMVGNVMKCPPKSELMRLCYEEAVATVKSDNTDWHKPIKILNRHVKESGLQGFINSGCGNPDKWDIVEEYIYGNAEPRENYMFIHWMNEEWRTRKIDKNDIPYRSALGKLLLKYRLMEKPNGQSASIKNDLRYLLKAPRLYSQFFRAKLQNVK
jgi:mannosyltransferase OCH1-like enzyme